MDIARMPDSSSSIARVSSPTSTGGAGTFFEQHVNAHWLALLLVRALPPVLRDCVVTEVHFQTEHLGWKTDDFLIVGEAGSGAQRKLLGQVKKTFTVSARNDECKKVIRDCWEDFRNTQQFVVDSDQIAIVTLRGTNVLLDHFVGLLDCARAAADTADFEHRLTIPGIVHSKVSHYCQQVRNIVDEAEGRAVAMYEVWPFLKALHLVSLDLNTSTAQTEALTKTLLAHTTREQDALGAANATWDALLTEVGQGMPQARSYTQNTLPEALRQRHSPLSGQDHGCLNELKAHSLVVLDGIKTEVGNGTHLPRTGLVHGVLEQLESDRVVVVTGKAGSGKSAVAKDALSILADSHFVFCFRAEELARAHLDETLLQARVSCGAVALASILAGQDRKIMLVESVERLLEASTRDAFSDLLRLVDKDPSWRLLLTCRDYSVDLVRTAFLDNLGIVHSVLTVGPLDDTELATIESSYPAITRPLASPPLRSLLRIPYVLDMALRMPWQEDQPLPSNEREFRARFWQIVVRADQFTAFVMPQRRERAFIEIALRRARALSMYVPCGDIDSEAAEAFVRDSLIVYSPRSRAMVAPAHDVLEDWAILHLLDEQYALSQASIGDFSATLGTYPALRRTYRKWVSELIERDPEAADKLFLGVLAAGFPSTCFRDDTLIAMMRSVNSSEFINRHREVLFRNEKYLLKRIIHLLRVGCVKNPEWLTRSTRVPLLVAVPDSPAWACVLQLVRDGLPSFAAEDEMLLLGFIEDWARGVSYRTPYPDAANAVAAIAHWLLYHFNDYQSSEQLRKTLQVIAKIPNADRDGFATLLRGDREDDRRDQVCDELRKLVLEEMEGMPASRDLPELVVEVGTQYILCDEEDLRDEWGYGSSLGTELQFGIKEARSFGFYPPSGIRGPFAHLLRHHPKTGLHFIIDLCNRSADWYGQRKAPSRYVEQPFETTLTFSDGTLQTQWCNPRLWNFYRGTSVGPYVMQSALMALELWLLELAENDTKHIDNILLKILQESKSVALTAVVASVATAFPHAAGETLLVLLSSSDCVFLDRQRMVYESQTPSLIYACFPQFDYRKKIYEEERKQSDARPHRRYDLEMAILNLQCGPLAPRVQETLDRHRSQLPPEEEQDESHRIWRLSLHRMDLRLYTVAKVEEAIQGGNGAESQSSKQRVLFNLNVPDPDIKEMTVQAESQHKAMSARIELQMWALKVFRGEEGEKYDPGEWRERLEQAREAEGTRTDSEVQGFEKDGPGTAAAVSARDHWDEMTDQERQWCVDVICSEVRRNDGSWTRCARIQRNPMSADRACACTLPALLTQSLENDSRHRILETLAVALTHSVDEVRAYAALGIGYHLCEANWQLALLCVNASALQSTLVQTKFDEQCRLHYAERRELDDIEADVAVQVRQRFFESDGISENEHETFDATCWIGADANVQILYILYRAPKEPAACAAFRRLASDLVAWWDSDEERRHERQGGHRERNYDAEETLLDLLAEFLLQVETEKAAEILTPILDAVNRHPDKVYRVLVKLITTEDRCQKTAHFWSLWKLFADKIRTATWLDHVDDNHPLGGELMGAVFLVTWWKDDIRHWRSLEGYADNVHLLFEELPASAMILDEYVRFLYHIGEQSLPMAFTRIAQRLSSANPQQLLQKSNTVFMLESLLQRYVYSRPLELKQSNDLKEAVLCLLDLLVERGSSAAFHMRDDFVTPLAAP